MPVRTTPEATCPSCSSDGGYGTAVAGQSYYCPACHVRWSPAPETTPPATRFGNWLQRLKVRLTS